jgi:hypothetical protein
LAAFAGTDACFQCQALKDELTVLPGAAMKHLFGTSERARSVQTSRVKLCADCSGGLVAQTAVQAGKPAVSQHIFCMANGCRGFQATDTHTAHAVKPLQQKTNPKGRNRDYKPESADLFKFPATNKGNPTFSKNWVCQVCYDRVVAAPEQKRKRELEAAQQEQDQLSDPPPGAFFAVCVIRILLTICPVFQWSPPLLLPQLPTR